MLILPGEDVGIEKGSCVWKADTGVRYRCLRLT